MLSLNLSYQPSLISSGVGHPLRRYVDSLGTRLNARNTYGVGLDIVPLHPNLEDIDPILAWRVTWMQGNLYVPVHSSNLKEHRLNIQQPGTTSLH